MNPKTSGRKPLIAVAVGALALLATAPLLTSASASLPGGSFAVQSHDLKNPSIVGMAGMAKGAGGSTPGGSEGENPGGGTPGGSEGETPGGTETPGISRVMEFTIDTAATDCGNPEVHVAGVGEDTFLVAPDGTKSALQEGANPTPTSGQWKIEGTFSTFGGSLISIPSKNCLTAVDRWENTETVDISRAFMNNNNITRVAEPPHTVENMNYMFSRTTGFNGDISGWDVSNVTNMGSMFYSATAFSQDLSSWKPCKIASAPTNFSRGSQLSGEPQWGVCD